MTTQFNRRALLAGSAAVAGTYLASQVDDVSTLTTRLGGARLQSLTSEPLFVAMLDTHAQRLQPLIPAIERQLNMRLQIDALTADQLYANYTIDLLQQTGRYDAVSINDHWIPYFGRRGYLSEVEELAGDRSAVSYPPLIEEAATGIDDTRFVAYPWTIDFTCSALHTDLDGDLPAEVWSRLISAAQDEPTVKIGFGLQVPRSAAEVYRSVLLSFGEEILREDDGEPILDHHWQTRAMEMVVRMAALSPDIEPTSIGLARVTEMAENGLFNMIPVLWSSDSRPLIATGTWNLNSLPAGRPGRRRSFVDVWMWGIPAGAPNNSKARDFVQIMTGDATQVKLWANSSLIPATRSAIQSDEPGWLPIRPLVFDALDRGVLRPQLRSYRSIMEIVGQSVAEAVTFETPIATVMESANRTVREILTREGELKGYD